jgi:hypothetical protein
MTTRRLALAALPAAIALTANRAAAQPASGLVGTITGTIPANGGTASGVLNITSFAVQNGTLTALGTLTATLRDAVGNVIGNATQAIALPLAVSGSCTILTLTLGPLDLNLLGLMVHLTQVVLTITAQQGPGNLLGNLLCAIANLLNSGGALQGLLSGLAALLNRVLGAL